MRYDVFLSFGEEVRKTFLSHLLYSLDRKGIRSITSTASYPPENRAVQDSLVGISIISKNFTSSDRWVEELAKIIAWKRKTVPVFLRVDPMDVLRVLDLAKDSVGTNEPRRNTLEMVKNWLDGHVTSKSGFNSSDWEDDSQLVDKITCFVSDTVTQYSISNRWCPSGDWLTSPSPEPTPLVRNSIFLRSNSSEVYSMRRKTSTERLTTIGTGNRSLPHHRRTTDSPPSLTPSSSYKSPSIPFFHRSRLSETVINSSPPETITGITHRVEEVLSMLRLRDSTNEVRSIGIYGMEGVGKTTLAEYVYEEISPQFQYHFFMTNFSKKGSSLLEILAGETLNATTNFSGNSDVITEMVGRKVLLLVDSVDDIKQLKDFAKEVSLFGPGSRIIVIAQDRSLLVQCGVNHIYQVGCPGYDEAFQLFSKFAFKQTNPVSGFERFSGRAVEVAGRIPLALKVLGSYLYGRNEDEWESTLCRLEESHISYTTAEVLKYIGADDPADRIPNIVELDENEENLFPLYSFTLQ